MEKQSIQIDAVLRVNHRDSFLFEKKYVEIIRLKPIQPAPSKKKGNRS